MFVKLDFARARAAAREVRLAAPATRRRNGLVATWRREPSSGRLELEWTTRAERLSHEAAA